MLLIYRGNSWIGQKIISIRQYIKDKNLQNPADMRQIIPDEQLCSVLNYEKTDDKPLTYFIQSLITKANKIE